MFINVDMLRTLLSCLEDHEAYLKATSGLSNKMAKDMAYLYFGQVNAPFPLYKDTNLPIIAKVYLDPLHDVKIGNE